MEKNEIDLEENFSESSIPHSFLIKNSIAYSYDYWNSSKNFRSQSMQSNRFSFEVSYEPNILEARKSLPVEEKKTDSSKPLTIPELLNTAPSQSLIFANNSRKIYYSTDFTDQEKRLLMNFKNYLDNKNLSTLVPLEVYEGNFLALRCLQASAGNFKKAFDKMRSILLWKDRNISNKEKIIQALVIF